MKPSSTERKLLEMRENRETRGAGTIKGQTETARTDRSERIVSGLIGERKKTGNEKSASKKKTSSTEMIRTEKSGCGKRNVSLKRSARRPMKATKRR